MSSQLTRKERQELEESIAAAKAKLAADKATRPKRQLTQKQLDNLARGRSMNPRFHPKKKDDTNNVSDKQSEDTVNV